MTREIIEYRVAYECESHAGDWQTWHTQVVETRDEAEVLLDRHECYSKPRIEVRTRTAWERA